MGKSFLDDQFRHGIPSGSMRVGAKREAGMGIHEHQRVLILDDLVCLEREYEYGFGKN